MSDASDAAEVQGALGVISGQIVLLQEALRELLAGQDGASAKALRALAAS